MAPSRHRPSTHDGSRGRGAEARRSLLYLDTEPDKPAFEMYQRTGWMRAGEIPDYARTPDGRLHSTVLLYRRV
jgi:hypothetical protein